MAVVYLFVTTQSAPTSIGEEAAIRSLLNDRLAALYDKDAARLVGFYSPDIVSFDLAPPLAERGPEIVQPASWQPWLDSWDGPIVVALAHVGMRVSGNLAWCHSLNHMTGLKVDGEEVDLWFRATCCFERTDRWRIVHEHQSVPFAMDGSRLAQLDLVP